jgi:methionine-rich copper-binding protein CopC
MEVKQFSLNNQWIKKITEKEILKNLKTKKMETQNTQLIVYNKSSTKKGVFINQWQNQKSRKTSDDNLSLNLRVMINNNEFN